MAMLAAWLAGCAKDAPSAQLIEVRPEAPAPMLVDECWRDNPPVPALPKGYQTMDEHAREVATLRVIEARKADRARVAGWRMVCRASLARQLPLPTHVGKAAAPGS